MTKSLIWVGAVVVVFVLLLLLGRATHETYVMKNAPQMTSMPQTNSSSGSSNSSSKNLSGDQLVAKLGCTNCHGTDLSGTRMAPSLHAVSSNWGRETLINYLRNPDSYMSNSRFQAYRAKYPNTMMPSFNNIDVKDLGKVADYLLSLSK